jgi:hypothetical protein
MASDTTDELRAQVAESQRLHKQLLAALDEDAARPNLGLCELPAELTGRADFIASTAEVLCRRKNQKKINIWGITLVENDRNRREWWGIRFIFNSSFLSGS